MLLRDLWALPLGIVLGFSHIFPELNLQSTNMLFKCRLLLAQGCPTMNKALSPWIGLSICCLSS
jgi:hypothetical protein